MQSSTLPSKAVEQQKFSMISIEHVTGNKKVGDEYVLTQFHSDTMTKANYPWLLTFFRLPGDHFVTIRMQKCQGDKGTIFTIYPGAVCYNAHLLGQAHRPLKTTHTASASASTSFCSLLGSSVVSSSGGGGGICSSSGMGSSR